MIPPLTHKKISIEFDSSNRAVAYLSAVVEKPKSTFTISISLPWQVQAGNSLLSLDCIVKCGPPKVSDQEWSQLYQTLDQRIFLKLKTDNLRQEVLEMLVDSFEWRPTALAHVRNFT